MHANNETGVLQPIAAAADLVHAAGGLLHVDAVQTAGRIPCDIKALKADLVTVSSHKIGGPQGVGALVKAAEGLHFADPLLKGGGPGAGQPGRNRECRRHCGLRGGRAGGRRRPRGGGAAGGGLAGAIGGWVAGDRAPRR